MADLLENVYLLALALAPLAFLVGGIAAAVQGDHLQAGGFMLVAAVVGGVSVYFWRGGDAL